ncbi:hypothetical protein E5Q_05240 [Mixia osmundae IAM 14324]|uniref:Uncharacterized protein n=1 Tax=Mixia osmundae (strain CBS 9802 / IAM 14324 / JCM 22182 / KY 12970) TaxID=764103 RepID=G7E6U2_MIXOS|nr:hypothetical protein E5Q_05240 [Mixia osmundae IAM 14324]
MGTEVTPEELLELIRRLYAPTSSAEEQRQVQHVLFEAQRSTGAWQWSSWLLTSPHDAQSRFFGALTLSIKISRDFISLPEGHQEQLKQSLMEILYHSAPLAYPANHDATANSLNAASSERIVLRKLAVAATALAIKIAPRDWSEWLLSLMTLLSSAPCSRQAVFEVLAVITEESERADLIGKRRVQFEHTLTEAGSLVARTIIDTLTTFPSSHNDADLIAALRCLQSWLTSKNIRYEDLDRIYPLTLPLLLHPPTAEQASDCIEDFLADLDFLTPTRAEPLLDYLSSQYTSQAIAEAIENESDTDILPTLKLLVATFEHSATTIVRSMASQRSVTLLRHLLLLSTFPGTFAVDEEVSIIGLPTWVYLQEEMADEGLHGTSTGDDQGSETVQRWKLGQEIFAELSTRLLVKLQWPPESETQGWTKDTFSRYSNYRSDVGDTLIHAYYVIRVRLLEFLVSTAIERSAQASRSGGPWEPLEACLYALQAIQEAIPEETDAHLPDVFARVLTALPVDAPTRLTETTLLLIGNYTAWLNEHPAYILQALTFVAAALSRESVWRSAAMAIRRLCSTCRVHLIGHVGSFVALVANLEGRLPSSDFAKVVESVAAVVQAMPMQDAVPHICLLVQGTLHRVAQAHASLSSPSDSTAARDTVLQSLAVLSACIRGLAEPEADLLLLDGDAEGSNEAMRAQYFQTDARLIELRGQMLACICTILPAAQNDVELAIAVGELVRQSTTTPVVTPLSLDPADLLSPLSSAVATSLDPSLLGTLTAVIAAAARDSPGDKALSSSTTAFTAVFRTAGSHLASRSLLESHPDVVHALYDFAAGVLRHFPQAIAGSPALDQACQHCILAMQLSERVALTAVLRFVSMLVHETWHQYSHAALLKPTVERHGQEIVIVALKGISGEAPRSVLDPFGELFQALSKAYSAEFPAWLHTGLSSVDPVRIDEAYRMRFIKQINASRSLKQTRKIITEFALSARGLTGSVYGVSST